MVIGGEYGHLAERILFHSVSQSMIEGIQGGNMLHRFMTAGVSASGNQFLTKYGGHIGKSGQLVVSSVIGGTTSQLGGGKFANGAVTGAYIMMFNCNSKKKEEHKKIHAIGKVLGTTTEALLSVSADITIAVTFYDGPEKGNTILYAAGAVGIGGVSISLGVSEVEYTYHGDINNFTRESLVGQSYEYTGSLGPFSYTYGESRFKDRYDGWVTSHSYSAGGGVSLLPIGGKFTQNYMKLYRQYRNDEK